MMRDQIVRSGGRARAWCGAAALALLLASPASTTQEYILPTLFDVSGVASDDVLNIRAEPNANAEIIGTLAPNARGIEVVAHDDSGRWAQLNADGRSGWAALSYLAYRTDVWEHGKLPETMHCLGTEPFWSLAAQGDEVVFSTPGEPERPMTLEAALDQGTFRSPRRAILATSGSRRLTAVIAPTSCSDGMSDKAYGLDATLVIEGPAKPRMLTGCCSVAPR